jgi:Virulence factor BrkB
MNQILGTLSRVAPGDVLTLVRDQILQISKNNNGGLLTIGFIGTIWSASSGMSSVSSVLNRAYHVEEGRSWIRVGMISARSAPRSSSSRNSRPSSPCTCAASRVGRSTHSSVPQPPRSCAASDGDSKLIG